MSSVSTKSFFIPVTTGSSIEINIAEPNLRADNLNLTTWTSSYILACQLHKLKSVVITDANDNDNGTNIPILELGAGTGLVSLTAAVLWKHKPILTDLAGIVAGLRTNVDINADILRTAGVQPECGTLDWTVPETLALESGRVFRAQQNKASIILAADTIYDDSHPELLSHTIFQWLVKSTSARVIMTYPLRVCYLDQIREIWTLLEEGGLIAEESGQETADARDWDDECLCEWVVWRWRDM